MRRHHLLGTLAAAGTIALLGTLPLSADAVAPRWAPAATAAIHPGVQTFTAGAQCTANFVFTDSAGAVYIGQAAHCSGTGAATDTDGCIAKSLPLNTKVQVTGASRLGTMVYNSWLAMQAAHERRADVCANNDFALIKLDPADYAKVNPTVPHWGGPNGIATSTTSGERVYSYGNSELRLGISALSPKEGVSLGDTAGGWSRDVYTVTPGIPGDSGSGFLNSTGKAIGVLHTIEAAPLPASNQVIDLSRSLSYAASHGRRVTLVRGTVAFNGGALPAG